MGSSARGRSTGTDDRVPVSRVATIREPAISLQPVLDCLPVAAYLCDAAGLITYFNPRAVELWGRAPALNDPADRWCGSFRLFRPDGTPISHVQCWMARAILEDRPYTAQEIMVERPDGSRIHGLAHASPLHDDAGHLVGAINVLVDITERRLGAEARAHLAAIVQDSQDAIISMTLEGVVTSWNGAALRLYGYTPAEMVGRPITSIIPPDRRDEEARILRRLARGERIESYETTRLTRDRRSVEVSLTISPLRDSHGRITGVSKIARDITPQKAEERRRRETEEALRDADRRKDEFLAIMAHELRNPLAPLVSSLDILQVSPDPDTAREVMGIVRRQVGTLVRLVDDLMDASRVARGLIELKCEVVPLADIVDSALEIARPLMETRAQRLVLDVPDRGVKVNGDPTRLTQVVANLLNNAAKYTPPEGRIEIGLRAEDGRAVLRVADNGDGIPPKMLAHIFEMFAQLDRSQERTQGGLGIGLSLVKRLVELHAGTIEARSDGAGRGSEFVVRLPLAASAEDAAPHGRPALVPTRHRVLVADDNTDAAKTLSLLLRTLGQEVHVVHSGPEALERAMWLRPDVLLLDIGMPGMSGYEVTRRVRAEAWGRRPLIVAMTGWGQEDDRRRSKDAGFDQHMVKPVTLEALCRLLMQAPAADPERGLSAL
jgi:PAS domain S-box-containing protein